MNGEVPDLPDFTAYERMAGEYRVMGICPRGHLMEFVRPGLDPRVLPAAAVDRAGEGEEVLVAGWPIARQHPKGQDGTVFVTIEDETGDAQVVLWPHVFQQIRKAVGQPRAAGEGRRFPLGRDRQHRRLGRAGHSPSRTDASRSRLALSGSIGFTASALGWWSGCRRTSRRWS